MKITNSNSYAMNISRAQVLPQVLAEEIDSLIHNTPILPGSDASTAEAHRSDMIACKNILISDGMWSQQQDDEKNRKITVGMQATIETGLMNCLTRDPTARLSVIVHTNNPPTPLCAEYLPQSLLHSGIRGNRAIESTVTSRQETNEFFLRSNNQVSFSALYGTKRASDAGQTYFDKKVASNPGLFAFHTQENPPVELSGATYVYTNRLNEKVIIGVRITQANDPSKMCSLFIGRDSYARQVSPHLRMLNDYIRTIQSNLLENSSVADRRNYFELMSVCSLIS
ncbi:hypothetical protein CSU65_000652 [Salmonella enterica subsp. diarizonae]|nr:hypothetical protein [Salmonella enterica subsp. diarizonae]